MGLTRNQVCPCGHLGFESLPLRQTLPLVETPASRSKQCLSAPLWRILYGMFLLLVFAVVVYSIMKMI